MYRSLKRWLNTPIQIKPFLSYDGAGDKTFGITVDLKCYPEGRMTQVVNTAGSQVLSKLQLYVDGNTVLKVTDIIKYNSKDFEIQSLGEFYDGKGNRDVWVVYL